MGYIAHLKKIGRIGKGKGGSRLGSCGNWEFSTVTVNECRSCIPYGGWAYRDVNLVFFLCIFKSMDCMYSVLYASAELLA